MDKNVRRRKITILSDGQAAIKALDSSVINFKTVYDCRRRLNEMANRYDVCNTRVPKYRDIPGNNRADELAEGAGTSNSPMNSLHWGFLRAYNCQCNRGSRQQCLGNFG